MKLYEIEQSLENLITELEHTEDLELRESLFAAIESISLEKDVKIKNICCVIKNAEAEEDIFDREIQRLKVKKEQAIKTQERLKLYLQSVVDITTGWQSEDSLHKISSRKSESVVVEDWRELPSIYVREVLEYEPDKKLIKQDLKSGATIHGASLKIVQNIQVK